MRNRFVGDNDYERTQRQRDVLSAIFKKASSLSAEELAKLSAVMLSEVGHDYNLFEMAAMVARLPKLAGYELVENRVPYDGLYTSQDEMLVPDFEATCEKLHEVIGE
jgi:anionic cell wall polymer biosynthesis LytR-Cps2A-Psr (LCP) family protein